MNDLKETSYQSYWNKELGKTRDPTPGLPAGTEPLSVTFGAPTKKGVLKLYKISGSLSHMNIKCSKSLIFTMTFRPFS